MIELYHGDCLEIMKGIVSGSIDAIITDPPYGTTACKWDSVIPFWQMWEHLGRIIKLGRAIALTGMQPFTSALVMSNPKCFCYSWVWEKSQATGHLNAYKKPMTKHEDIIIFSSNGKLPSYYPILTAKSPKDVRIRSGMRRQSECYGKHKLERDKYKKIEHNMSVPLSVLKINNEKFNTVHPTQKPVALMEYLIKTYTNEGETVLDFTMGSGTTGVAAKINNRSFIGIEKDLEYFKIAQKRIKEAEYQLSF
jgi:site-specific DNA-methyltransferase (adenine-specific)